MTHRRFFYNAFGLRLFRPIVILVLVLSTFTMLTFIMSAGFSSATLMLIVAWIVVCVPMFAGGFNAWPEIWVHEDYICIHYLFSRLQMPWSDVLGVTIGEAPLMGRFCLVHFRNLPYLVRLYQRNPAPYTSKPQVNAPFLVIYHNITDYEDLVAIIKAKIEDPTAKLFL